MLENKRASLLLVFILIGLTLSLHEKIYFHTLSHKQEINELNQQTYGLLWNRHLPIQGLIDSEPSMLELADQRIIAAIQEFHFNGPIEQPEYIVNLTIISLTADGNLQWMKGFALPPPFTLQTRTSGPILFNLSNDEFFVAFSKNETGFIWSFDTYGNRLTNTIFELPQEFEFKDATPFENHTVILLGKVALIPYDAIEADLWLGCCSDQGILLWNRTYSTQDLGEYPVSVLQCSGNYILVTGLAIGPSIINQLFAKKFDSNGSLLWTHYYDGYDYLGTIPRNEGGYLLFESGWTENESIAFIHVICIDEAGHELWRQEIAKSPSWFPQFVWVQPDLYVGIELDRDLFGVPGAIAGIGINADGITILSFQLWMSNFSWLDCYVLAETTATILFVGRERLSNQYFAGRLDLTTPPTPPLILPPRILPSFWIPTPKHIPILLSWMPSQDPDGTVDRYHVQIAPSVDFSYINVTKETRTNQTSMILSQSSATLYLRVRAIDNMCIASPWNIQILDISKMLIILLKVTWLILDIIIASGVVVGLTVLLYYLKRSKSGHPHSMKASH
jgi:hypothetical protein